MERRRLMGAVFGDRDRAEAAAEDLRTHRPTSSRLPESVAGRGRHVIEGGVQPVLERGVLTGGIAGGAAGAAAAALIGGLIWGSLGIWLIWGAAGALVGSVVGAYLGLSRRSRELWEREDWEHLSLAEGEVLLVVDPGPRAEEVESVLHRRGGRLVEPNRPG